MSYEVLSAEEALEDGEADDCEVLIVDPPRKVKSGTDTQAHVSVPPPVALNKVIKYCCELIGEARTWCSDALVCPARDM